MPANHRLNAVIDTYENSEAEEDIIEPFGGIGAPETDEEEEGDDE